MRAPATPESHARAVAFADRLREAMRARGLTQSELARRIGCNQSVVSDWLREAHIPLGAYLVLMPAILRADGHWLLTGEGSMYRGKESDPVAVTHARGGLAVLAQLQSWVTVQQDALAQAAATPSLEALTPQQKARVLELLAAEEAAAEVLIPAVPTRGRVKRKR